LMAGDDDEMFMTISLNITPNTTEQHLITCSDTSVACVTNNNRVCSTFCTIEANYWHTRSIVQPLCDSRATCPSDCVVVCVCLSVCLYKSECCMCVDDSDSDASDDSASDNLSPVDRSVILLSPLFYYVFSLSRQFILLPVVADTFVHFKTNSLTFLS